jgi:FdhE protein
MTNTDKKDTVFQSVGETAKTIIAEKPDLQAAISSFGGMLEASQKVQALLGPWNTDTLVDVDTTERLAQGESILNMVSLLDFTNQVASAASIMFPAMQKAFSTIAGDVEKISAVAQADSVDLYPCLQGMVAGDEQLLKTAAEKSDVSYDVFTFVMSQLLSPFVHSQAKSFASAFDLSAWTKGYCPVCGSFPSVSYLVGEGGKRWLHCAECGHEWRFQRQICPYCEDNAAKGLDYFYIEDRLAERAYVCKECKKYLLTIDIRELALKPNMDIAPVGLIALDVKAQEEGYAPLVDLPWNNFTA